MWLHLLKLDMLAPSVQLRIAGNTSSKSLVGVVLFLSYLGFALWTCFVQILNYQDKTKPAIHTDNTFLPQYPPFDLKASNSIPIIIGSYRTVTYLKPEELKAFVTLKLWVTRFELIADKGEYESELLDVPIIPCKLLMDSGHLDLSALEGLPSTYLEIIPEYGMCANTTGFDVTVVGSNTDRLLRSVELSISPCSLPGGVGCKPAVEVNRMWIQTLSPRVGLNLSSHSDPVHSRVFPDDLFPLNVNNLQLFKYEMVKNEIQDSFGFLTKDQPRAAFATQIARSPNWKPRDPTLLFAKPEDLYYLTTAPYAVIDWASGTKFNLIRRNYQGIIDLVSNIGGLNSIFWALACGLHMILHPLFEKAELVNRVFGIKTSTNNCFGNCRRKQRSHLLAAAKTEVQHAKIGMQTQLGCPQHITSNSPYTIVSKEVFEEASKIIDKDLDVVNICQQLHELRILVDLLLKKDQTELIPLATLCRHTSDLQGVQGTRSLKESSKVWPETMMPDIPRENEMQGASTERLQLFSNKDPQPVAARSDPVFTGTNWKSEVLDSGHSREIIFQALLEGLEEEFNKLIRTEAAVKPPGGLTSEPEVSHRQGLQSLLNHRLRRPSGSGSKSPTALEQWSVSAPKDLDSPRGRLRRIPTHRDEEMKTYQPQTGNGGGFKHPSNSAARPNSNILSMPIPVRLAGRTSRRVTSNSGPLLNIPPIHPENK